MTAAPEPLLHPTHPLRSRWVGGALAETFDLPTCSGPRGYDGLLGNYNPLRPFAVTVFGAYELAQLNTAVAPEGFAPALVMVADNALPPSWMIQQTRYPVLVSPLSAGQVIAVLWRELPPRVGMREVLHGTVVSVFGQGLLLKGPPGIGKSSLALSLLQRGHRLVADDAPEVAYLPDGQFLAVCPREIEGRLHVRGLGLVDVCGMFGKASFVAMHPIHAIIRLVEHCPYNAGSDVLLFGNRTTVVGDQNNVTEWVLSASQAHDPAAWVETCARTLLLET